ncbi:MAG: 3-isopropylmalate dehydratase small subunit, partial [Deltaproteobacteria bacterium]|nr:3-isopropylmalate dehydratase small subunit [Deltaproteobacteria bacterium]
MEIKGKVWELGNNIDTDMILPGKYLSLSNPSLLGEHCLEGVAKGWAEKISPGDILIAGKNFGCGSSREHAPIALRAAGLSCVVAESFGAIFYRNAINVGFPVVELEGVRNKFDEGDIVQADIKRGI